MKYKEGDKVWVLIDRNNYAGVNYCGPAEISHVAVGDEAYAIVLYAIVLPIKVGMFVNWKRESSEGYYVSEHEVLYEI